MDFISKTYASNDDLSGVLRSFVHIEVTGGLSSTAGEGTSEKKGKAGGHREPVAESVCVPAYPAICTSSDSGHIPEGLRNVSQG